MRCVRIALAAWVSDRLNPCRPGIPGRALRRCGRHTARARALLAILPLLLGLQAAIPASAREWHFDVSVDGLPIGSHDLVVRENGDARSVQSDMRFGMLGVNAYKQHAEETWQANCLTRLDTRTEEKGNVTTVSGRLDASAFAIDGPRGHERLASCVMTFAYWNPRVLKQSGLINFQTGAWTPITVHTLGKEQIEVRGNSVAADHFRIDTERNRIELWYSPEGEWIGLRSTTRNGHVLEYRLR
jgi:Family of unknown function (DUF6134)